MTVKELRAALKGRKPESEIVMLQMELDDLGKVTGQLRKITLVRKAEDDGRIFIEATNPTESRRWDDWRP